MESYSPQMTAYTGEVVCDVVFLNPVFFTKDWCVSMKTGVEYITVILKHVFLPNITMIKKNKINILPKRCKKKKATKLGAQKRRNEDIDELLKEIHRRDKLDTEFDREYDGEHTNDD